MRTIAILCFASAIFASAISTSAPTARAEPLQVAECRAPADYPNIKPETLLKWKRVLGGWHKTIKGLHRPTTCAQLQRFVCVARAYVEEVNGREFVPATCRLRNADASKDADCAYLFEIATERSSENDSGYPQPGWCGLTMPAVLLSVLADFNIIPAIPRAE